MQLSLSGFETDLLDKFIHTQTFDELTDLQMALNETLNGEKDRLITEGVTNDTDFNSFVDRTTENITQYLVDHEFFHPREGGVYFLTDKGKHLKAQGSMNKYEEWEKIRDKQLVEDIHAIQTKGYLDREQPTPAELAPPPVDNEKKSYLIYYILIIVALIAFYLVGKYHKFN